MAWDKKSFPLNVDKKSVSHFCHEAQTQPFHPSAKKVMYVLHQTEEVQAICVFFLHELNIVDSSGLN